MRTCVCLLVVYPCRCVIVGQVRWQVFRDWLVVFAGVRSLAGWFDRCFAGVIFRFSFLCVLFHR